jgi:hypothetical protein
MTFYTKDDLNCKYVKPIPSEDLHDTFMPLIQKYPQLIALDMKTCNLMDQFRDDNGTGGYGMADGYLVGPNDQEKTMLFVFGCTNEMVDVSVASNYFQGSMSTSALSIACQILWHNHLSAFAHSQGKEQLSSWAAKMYYALKDVIYLKEIGLSDNDRQAITGFLD